MSSTLMGTLQQAIRSTFGCANDFNGDLHVLADYWGIPMNPISGRTIDVARKYDASINSASAALNYLLQNPTIAVPGLALNMVSGSTLDPRITFSRTSNATQFDAAGNLVYAPHNLLTFSEQFDNSAWSKTRATVTANATAAPNGTTTADKLVEDTTASNTHQAFQSQTVTSGLTYHYSVYAKASERTQIAVNMSSGAGAFSVAAQVIVDLTNGTIVSGSGVVTDAGSGWYRISVSNTAIATAAADFVLRISVAGNTSYTGNGTSGLFLWGAQLNVGALQPYYPTTVKNLLGYTQEINDAYWTKSGSSVTANAVAAPDGSMTAEKLVEDTSTGEHRFGSASITWIGNGVYTASFYAKAAERTSFDILLGTAGNWVNGNDARVATFDLSAGTASTPTLPGVASITAVGNGWYRCRITCTAVAAPSASGVFARMNSGGSASYTGDGTSGMYFWGAQLSDSASLDTYVYNPVAAPTAAAYYGPRFDYDPATLAARGLLIEEQRTNSIRNNTMQGAVAGTPGTLPTNWQTFTSLTGLTREIVGTGTESGINYIDIRLSGTPSGSGAYNIFAEAITATAALSGQVWTYTQYSKLTAGSTSGITSIQSVVIEYSAASGFLSQGVTNFTPTSDGLGTQRYGHTRTLTNASTAFVRPSIQLNLSGAAIDITLRIGLPQLEQGAFATSVIPTTTAAATRAADVATMIGANFSNWYNQSEGTMFVEGSVVFPVSGNNQFLMRGSDGTYNNSNAMLVSDGGALRIATASGGVFDGIAGNVFPAANAIFKTAGAYKTNDLAISSNGLAVVTDATATIPLNLTRMDLGGDHAGFNRIRAGYLRRIAYFPRRLANSELQAVTA